MNTDAIRQLVRAECLRESNRFGCAFFDQHIDVVVHYARQLASQLGANQEVIELAGYLHDLAAIRDFKCLATHHVEGARIARDVLKAHSYPADVIAAVCRSIESHSFPAAIGRSTLEEVCLSNADVMSHIMRPAYWFYYLYSVRGLRYEDGLAWMRGRIETNWERLMPEAREMVAAEHAALVQICSRA